MSSEGLHPGEDEWEARSVIPLMPLVEVNHCQPILHMSKIIFHCYYTDESINQFEFGYMINPQLKCNKVFRLKVENA